MSKEFFSSPREEALQIAYQTRKTILTGKNDPVATLRACLVIANDLGKKSMMEWINNELSGYSNGQLPDYRVVNCNVTEGTYEQDVGFQKFEARYPIHLLFYHYQKNLALTVSLKKESPASLEKTLHIFPNRLQTILAAVIDRCFLALNEIITELQFGGVVEYLMEEIRRKTDEKLATFDTRITEETQSLYLNLNSTNPADWSKVGHSCRKILKFLADRVFPPSDGKYTAKDNKEYDVTDPCFINRLYAFLDTNSSASEKRFIGAQLEYLESYLKQVVNYAQSIEHNPSIDKFHANLLAIHTYLVISDILRHMQDKPSGQ